MVKEEKSVKIDENSVKNSEKCKDFYENSENVNSEENLQQDAAEEFLQNNEKKETSNEEALQEEVERLRDEKLRLLAEMDNLRKRYDRERLDSIKYGSISFARDILSPDDNLTRALEAIPQNEKNSATVDNLVSGLKMVQKEFSTILEKYGVNKIEALNKKFDHNFHQAVVEVENDEADVGTVINEMQCGYTMHDKLLRPSMVGVSKKTKNHKGDEHKSDEKD
jgi:molecular chaperone GrpE